MKTNNLPIELDNKYTKGNLKPHMNQWKLSFSTKEIRGRVEAKSLNTRPYTTYMEPPTGGSME
jgi:hypothetical protein